MALGHILRRLEFPIKLFSKKINLSNTQNKLKIRCRARDQQKSIQPCLKMKKGKKFTPLTQAKVKLSAQTFLYEQHLDQSTSSTGAGNKPR